jgi:hypothetical protein
MGSSSSKLILAFAFVLTFLGCRDIVVNVPANSRSLQALMVCGKADLAHTTPMGIRQLSQRTYGAGIAYA